MFKFYWCHVRTLHSLCPPYIEMSAEKEILRVNGHISRMTEDVIVHLCDQTEDENLLRIYA